MRTRPCVIACSLFLSSIPAFAQLPAPPPTPLSAQPAIKPTEAVWTQSASVGLALTSGNKDTSTVNAGFEVIYSPPSRNRARTDGLFLRGRTDGELTADRLQLNGRDEFRLAPRVYTFGQVQYLRDQFKDIDYLVAPTGGLGLRLAETDATTLSIDAGVGGVWEKKPLFDVQASGATAFSEKFVKKLSSSATLTQGLTALYRTEDFGNALYVFNAGVAASLTAHTQVKVELLDIYKRRVAPGFENNDVAVIVGLVFKR